ncbi:Maf family protein [Treponema lecithinolyticum]
MEKLILASTSAQRKNILHSLHIPFYEYTPPFEEIIPPNIKLDDVSKYFAVQKAECTAAALTNTRALTNTGSVNVSENTHKKYTDARLIVGADTLIVFDGKAYGKPKDKNEAASFLHSFSGKTHKVISGIAVHNRESGKTLSRSCVSTVSFAVLSGTDIEHYLSLGEWQGAAGAYKIQGFAQCFISHISGSFSSIIGLPIFEFYEIIKQQGYVFEHSFCPDFKRFG